MNLTPMDSAYDWDNQNDGFISKLSAKGEIIALKWIDGFVDPAGMLIRDNFLYVADNEFLVIIDITKGKVIRRFSAKKLRKEKPASIPYTKKIQKRLANQALRLRISEGTC